MSVNELSTLITASATVVYTLGTFLLWKVNRQTLQMVQREVQNQISSSHSASYHGVLDAHRELILELLRDEKLLGVFSTELGYTKDQTRSKFIATLFINQASRIFADYNHHLAGEQTMESFSSDAAQLFSLPFIKERWQEVKVCHSVAFQKYVDTRLLLNTDNNEPQWSEAPDSTGRT